MTLAHLHPANFGPKLLYYLKQGKPVEKVIVHLTHQNIHEIYRGDDNYGHDSTKKLSRQVRERFPLEMTLPTAPGETKTIDCRFFTSPWHIDVRTDEQKQEANRLRSAPAPMPPEPLTQEEEALCDAVLEPFYLRAEAEYRVVMRAHRTKLFLEQLRQQKDQQKAEDTAHG